MQIEFMKLFNIQVETWFQLPCTVWAIWRHTKKKWIITIVEKRDFALLLQGFRCLDKEEVAAQLLSFSELKTVLWYPQKKVFLLSVTSKQTIGLVIWRLCVYFLSGHPIHENQHWFLQQVGACRTEFAIMRRPYDDSNGSEKVMLLIAAIKQ